MATALQDSQNRFKVALGRKKNSPTVTRGGKDMPMSGQQLEAFNNYTAGIDAAIKANPAIAQPGYQPQQFAQPAALAPTTAAPESSAIPADLQNRVNALHQTFSTPTHVQGGRLTNPNQPTTNVAIAPPPSSLSPTAQQATQAPTVDPSITQITSPGEAIAALSPQVGSPGNANYVPAPMVIDGDTTPRVKAEQENALVPMWTPTGTVYADPATANAANAAEGQARIEDQRAQVAFNNSEAGREFSNRQIQSAIQAGDFGAAGQERNDGISFRRDNPGALALSPSGAYERSPNAIPDRAPGELSMADAVDLSGGDRNRARALVVQSRLNAQEQALSQATANAPTTGNEVSDQLARQQALAKQFGYDIPQNPQQGYLVELNVQKKQLDDIALRRDEIGSNISQIQDDAVTSAIDGYQFTNERLGGEVDRIVEELGVSRREALNEVINQQDPDLGPAAEQALIAAQEGALGLLNDPNTPYGQQLARLQDEYDAMNQLGARTAAKLPFSWNSAQLNALDANYQNPEASTPESQLADELLPETVQTGQGGGGQGFNLIDAMFPRQTSLGANRPGLGPRALIDGPIYTANYLWDRAIQAPGAVGGALDALAGETARGTAELVTNKRVDGRFRPLRSMGEGLGNAIADALGYNSNLPAFTEEELQALRK